MAHDIDDLERIARSAGPGDLHERLAQGHEKLARGKVWCRKCSRTQTVDTAECFLTGWPECCGETMTIDSPEEPPR